MRDWFAGENAVKIEQIAKVYRVPQIQGKYLTGIILQNPMTKTVYQDRTAQKSH